MNRILIIACLVMICLNSFSQDVILKTNDEIINCKIKEIGLDEVKYTLPKYPQDVLFVIDKDEITKIIFENGEEMKFEKAMNNPANYTDNKKNALKIEFMSPLFGNTTFGWEHSLKPGRSVEFTFGIAGLGMDTYDENAAGVFTKFGYKFIKSPDFYLRGMRYAHLLKGSYFKPELSLGLVSMDVSNPKLYYDAQSGYWYNTLEADRETVFAAAIQAVIGKQWIFDNAFSADIHGGIGYGFNTATRGYENTYHSGFIAVSEGFPISVSCGFTIGLLIK